MVVGSRSDGEVSAASAAAVALAPLGEVEEGVRAVDEVRERVRGARGRFSRPHRGVAGAVRGRGSLVFVFGGWRDASLDEVGVDALGSQRRAPDDLARFRETEPGKGRTSRAVHAGSAGDAVVDERGFARLRGHRPKRNGRRRCDAGAESGTIAAAAATPDDRGGARTSLRGFIRRAVRASVRAMDARLPCAVRLWISNVATRKPKVRSGFGNRQLELATADS